MAADASGSDRLAALRHEADSLQPARAEDYRRIFETTADGILIFDHAGQLVDVNPAACALHGRTRESILCGDPLGLIHPDSHAAFQAFHDTVTAGREFSGHVLGLRSDGSTFHAELHGIPYRMADEGHYFAVLRDVTARKRAEQRVAELRAKFRAAFGQ
ncbi:MAG: PAS domain S-box protein [Candidatus Brocadiae bacterium]|nr:PAS domain S-box protein [Candidatus Brocadiia bacterium]